MGPESGNTGVGVSRTLSGQLRSRVTLIVGLLALVLALSTILAARALMYQQLDDQLNNAQVLQQRGPDHETGRAPGIRAPGLAQGTIVVAELGDGTVLGDTVGGGQVNALDLDTALQLLSVPADGRKHTVALTGWGSYRVQHTVNRRGSSVVVALPLADVERTLAWLTAFAVGIGLLGVVAAAAVTRAVTNRATRPLRELSRTATEVSQLPLHSGQVSVPAAVTTDALPPEHEVTQLTTAFNRMLANVSGALAARESSEQKLRRFVADASHELRNPLASIRGYAELATRASVADNPDTTFALERIDSESARMTRLVNDLLLLARLDADQRPQPQPVDVVGTVLNAVSDARAAGPEHQWRLDLPEEAFDVMADPDQLHQAITNLLSNARTHTPPGTTVTTSVGTSDGWARIQVSDDGPGIPADVLPHVFERFTRGDAMRVHTATPSTGLGLAIVQAVVEKFGGRVGVESRPGRTVFSVELPLAADQ